MGILQHSSERSRGRGLLGMTDVGCHSAVPVQLGTGVAIMCTGIGIMCKGI